MLTHLAAFGVFDGASLKAIQFPHSTTCVYVADEMVHVIICCGLLQFAVGNACFWWCKAVVRQPDRIRVANGHTFQIRREIRRESLQVAVLLF